MFELQVHSHSIKQKECVNYLGVQLDQNLNYQNKVKNFLRKMACGIKTIYCVRDFFTNKNQTTVTKCPCHQLLTLLFYTLEWHFSKPHFVPGKTTKLGNQNML